jgi:carbon monoxide dehydrogenase subunit G
MEVTGDNEYSATLMVGVGAVKGTYEAKITMVDMVPHSSYKMLVEGTGSAGFVRGAGDIKLEEGATGGTVIQVEGDAQVGGTVALVGQRLMSTVSKQMMDRFFRCIGRSIT